MFSCLNIHIYRNMMFMFMLSSSICLYWLKDARHGFLFQVGVICVKVASPEVVTVCVAGKSHTRGETHSHWAAEQTPAQTPDRLGLPGGSEVEFDSPFSLLYKCLSVYFLYICWYVSAEVFDCVCVILRTYSQKKALIEKDYSQVSCGQHIQLHEFII